MENQFDLGLNIASIETELPDPVITLTGADTLTASDTAEMPLLALIVHGRSWCNRTMNVSDIGIEGYGIPVSSGGNYTDSSGQQWVCDELIVNSDGSGKFVARTAIETFDGSSDEKWGLSGSSKRINSNKLSQLAKPSTSSSVVMPCLCDRLTVRSGSETYNGTEGIAFDASANVCIAFSELAGNSDLSAWKAYLATNPVTVVYQLAVPTETELSAEQIAVLQPLINEHGAFTAYFMSTQDGTPTPETPVDIVSTVDLHKVSVPIQSIGDSGSMTVTTCGKNLLSPDSIAVGGFNSSNGVEVTSPQRMRTGFLPAFALRITFPQPTKFLSIYQYDNNKNFLGYSDIWTDTTSWVINDFIDNCKYIRLLLSLTDNTAVMDNDTLNIYKNGTMVEKDIGVTSTFEPYKATTAAITTALPLRSVPVSNNGNYTDSSGQGWICDTLDHVYGEPAKVTKRVGLSSLVYKYDMRGGGALTIVKSNGIAYHYIGESGTVYYQNNNWYVDLNGYFRMVSYNTETGAIVHDMNTAGQYYTKMPLGDRFLVGNWKNSDGTMYEGEQVLPAYKLSNGSEMPKDYICTTGIPTEGAEIIYPAASETILLTTKETEQLNSLSGYNGSTTVYNDNTAEMTVKLLREDYEMQYIYWIKESQSFICEKSGKYKIICVGGGASGGLAFAETAECLQAVGSTTSFGSIISASGAERSKGSYLAAADYGTHAVAGGQSGYDGINYASTACVATGDAISTGGNSSFMWETGHGYGAGGGAHGVTISGKALTAVAGSCGKVESTIVDLEENQAVFCTIGGGGVLNLSDNDVTAYATSVGAELTVSSGDGAKISACASSGADGVIIVQYLGL